MAGDEAITWIHLSDFHAGQRGAAAWAQIERLLKDDIREMSDLLGTPDLLLFTGDLAFKGNKDEYRKVDALLDRINEWLGIELPVFAVPGNHDLARPTIDEDVLRYEALKHYEGNARLHKVLWEGPSRFVDPLFTEYIAWAKRRMFTPWKRAGREFHVSKRMPGDFSAVFEKSGLRLGLVGLNSAWVQCDDGEFEGLLQLPAEQFHAALPGPDHPLDWFDSVSTSILLTHHPRGWLSGPALESYMRDIHPPDRFALALFGHTHLPKSEVVALSGTNERAFFQAPSLFGLEHYGSKNESRIFGYAWGRITPRGEVRVWPRKAHALYDNSYVFDHDSGFRPTKDELAGVVLIADRSRDHPAAPLGIVSNPEDLIAQAELDHYLARIESEHEYIQLFGFGADARLPLKLDGLYVDLDAVIDHGGRGRDVHASAELAAKAKLENANLYHEPLALDRAFERARQIAGLRGLVLLGDPGSGKTTHLKQVLLQVVREGAATIGLPAHTIPVFLPLQSLRDRTAGLPSFIDEQLLDPSGRTKPGFGQRLCERGKLLFLLDGLDEVADVHERELVAKWIAAALKSMPDCYFLVTCRYAGYTREVELEEVFLELHLRPLDDAQMRTFVRKWYSLVANQLTRSLGQAKIRAEQEAEDLIKVLSSTEFTANARVYEMTCNPLLLTAICLVHLDQGQLPDARAKLYDKSIAVLLERWQKRRTGKGLSADDALETMQAVAVWMHEARARWAKKDDLQGPVATALTSLGKAGVDASDFLDVIRNDAGLLTGWGMDEYGFMHLGFQEFLTAKQLGIDGRADRRVFDALAARFDDSWWREVILLLLAQRNPSVFEPFMRTLLDQPSFVDWWDSETMQLCIREAPVFSIAPFVELLRVEQQAHADLGPRQLAAAKLIARVMPAALDDLQDELRVHPTPMLREWWASGRPGPPSSSEVVRAKRGGIELVLIPGGRFLMGSPETVEGRDDDEPHHTVDVATFYLAPTPVTVAQYGEYLGANPGVPKPEYWGDRRFNQPEQPVVGVSWEDARLYCEWAGLVLPTEAQWEYACRAGTTTRYWSGNTEKDLARVGWYSENSNARLHGVREKEPNPFGLYDMHGNVWEWCLDVFAPYSTPPRPGDSLRREPVGDANRVFRGGSWYLSAGCARSAYRNHDQPGARYFNLGFRPAQGHP